MNRMNEGESARRKSNIDIGIILKKSVKKLCYVLAGYLCGACSLPFGAIPFGFALLAAANKNAVFVYAGSLLSALLAPADSSLLLVGIYTALLLLRILLRLTLDSPFARGSRHSPQAILSVLFEERLSVRLLVAASTAFAFYLCVLIGKGFLYYDLFALLISVSTAPIAAYLFYAFFTRSGMWRDAGFLSLIAVSAYAARNIVIYGVSLCVLGGIMLTMLITKKRSLLLGLLASLAVGLVYSPILMPIFMLSALSTAVFKKISASLACFTAFFGGIAWSFYILGIHALGGVFGGILCGCVLYSVADKLIFATSPVKENERSEQKLGSCRVLGESELDGVKLEALNRRMAAIGDAFESISSLFEEMNTSKLSAEEAEALCRSAFECSCEGCSQYFYCESRGIFSSASLQMSKLLLRGEQLRIGSLPPALSEHCTRAGDIIDEINYNCGCGNAFTPDLCATDYRALSRLLEKSTSAGGEFEINTSLSEQLCQALSGLCPHSLGVCVYGKGRQTVHIICDSREWLTDNKENITEIISKELPFTLSHDNAEIKKCADGATLTLREAPRLTLDITQRQVRAEREPKFCGDSLALLQTEDARFFSLISDGMGSGREAATVSEICTRFTERVLADGEMSDELISTLNGFLRNRGSDGERECSATFDLMELDLTDGKTRFFKSGAAPSYVFRDGSLFKLRSHSMPIGILRDSQAKKTEFELSEGDVVLMMSDGVIGESEECPWLYELLRRNLDSAGLERTADLVMKYALGNGSKDDITLVIMRVRAA